jgi:isochorismate synthase
LSALERDMSVLWDTGSPADAFAAAGTTHRIDLSGPARFQQLEGEATAVWRRIRAFTHPECKHPPAPRMFGGLAFTPGAARLPPWNEFGDGCFTLPRWSYARNQGNAILTLSVRGEECDVFRRSDLLGELQTILARLEAHRGQRTYQHALSVPEIPQHHVVQLEYPVWERHVDSIRKAIAQGRFAKIVAARRCDVALATPLNDIEALSRLTSELTCTRFAFRRRTTSFFGATPETLLSKRGDLLKTHALAGTIRTYGSEMPGFADLWSQLLSSGKDKREHTFVVSEICRSLAPYAVSIEASQAPVIRKLRNILHLDTPISAKLRPGTSTADLIAALHPTPAVGGVPKIGSAEWIAEHELCPRGWYSGPIGWIDSQGDATFAVAIRSGVLSPEYAYAFTGAGIVAESEPQAEYDETELKQLPFLRAVGVVV